MKTLAFLAALALAFPAVAQQKTDTTQSDRATQEGGQKNKSSASNAALTGKVKSALAADVGMKTMTSIDVDSNDGVVTLKGRVDNADSKALAEKIAKRVDGVKSVKNELKVGG